MLIGWRDACLHACPYPLPYLPRAAADPPLTRATATQATLLRSGRGSEVVMETRLWDEFKLATYSMRKKEGLADYRWLARWPADAAVVLCGTT